MIRIFSLIIGKSKYQRYLAINRESKVIERKWPKKLNWTRKKIKKLI